MSLLEAIPFIKSNPETTTEIVERNTHDDTTELNLNELRAYSNNDTDSKNNLSETTLGLHGVLEAIRIAEQDPSNKAKHYLAIIAIENAPPISRASIEDAYSEFKTNGVSTEDTLKEQSDQRYNWLYEKTDQ